MDNGNNTQNTVIQRIESNRKYRIGVFLARLKFEQGLPAKKKFEELATQLCGISQSKLDKIKFAYLDDDDPRSEMSFAYALLLSEMFTRWLGERVGVHDLYHPDCAPSELNIPTPDEAQK